MTRNEENSHLSSNSMLLQKYFLGVGPQIFEKSKKASKINQEAKEKAELYEQIGRLKMENEWLKKNSKVNDTNASFCLVT